MANLESSLKKTFGDFSELRFAVRSSALGEDSEELSAAGQNDTVLGCRGREQIAAALTRCWASLFAHHSVEYRRQHGQHIHPGMAVVVQRMVTSEVSGVMFTRDPVTGDPSRVTVTANYGLGESVVSARVEPDTITLHRGHDDQLNITDRQLGSKQLQTVMAEDGGTEERPLEGGAAAACCLSDADALRLARLGLQLEKAFGGARDVEWAVAEDTLYLLQSRPVTSFTGWTEFELTHECDSALLTDEECLTTANTGEVLPRAVTPLTSSTMCYGLSVEMQNLRKYLTSSGLPCPPYARQYCVLSHHRFGMDVTKTFLSTLQSWEEHDAERTIQLTILGHLEDWTRPRRTAVHRYGVLSWHARMHQMISMAGLTWHIAEDVRRGQRDFGRLRLRTDGLTTAQQALRHVCHELRHMQRVIQCHLLSSTWSQAPQMALLLLLAEDGARPFDQEVFSVFAMLLSSCSGAVSADVPSALERLARLIASSKDAAAFLSASQEDGLHWLRHRHTTVAAFFEDFLATHGHRALNELELHTTPWALDPGALVATLQTMVRNPDSLRNTKQETDVPQALSQLTVPLSGMTRRLVSFVLPYARRGVVQREQTKSLLVRMLHQFRLAFRRLAELMVRESRLPDSDLVFFLTLYEIQRLLDTRSPAIVTKALRRRRLFPKLDRMRFPEMIYGVPRPLAAQSSSQGTAGHLAVTGTPVCQGRVQGTARVVRDLAQAIEIQNDDILITHATDIGWSPYFPVLSGVVTELGGLISHGAVVAREYGLPCVVGATGATDLIQSGDIVILDGTLGTITRLQPSSDAPESVAEVPDSATESSDPSESAAWAL
ncbi:putative phosphoenolpyruvate synthase [Pollicipes pollicipes]|uniref:putative phosphoenolpyruvate synthase n=1 Tax=Pollicipes pollicipes TaxID=41117 RepID=UPI001884D78D|nr:putative phosphoenolpyruvate synthase [Pollicipes pollicipes]